MPAGQEYSCSKPEDPNTSWRNQRHADNPTTTGWIRSRSAIGECHNDSASGQCFCRCFLYRTIFSFCVQTLQTLDMAPADCGAHCHRAAMQVISLLDGAVSDLHHSRFQLRGKLAVLIRAQCMEQMAQTASRGTLGGKTSPYGFPTRGATSLLRSMDTSRNSDLSNIGLSNIGLSKRRGS